MGNQGFSKIKQQEHYKLINDQQKNIDASRSLFDRIGSGIDRMLEIFVNHGDKFDRSFNEQEAKEFLNKFK